MKTLFAIEHCATNIEHYTIREKVEFRLMEAKKKVHPINYFVRNTLPLDETAKYAFNDFSSYSACKAC